MQEHRQHDRERRFGARVHLHPVKKKFVKNSEKFKKFQKNWVVDNLMREVRSNFQNIWTSVQLLAKKTNQTRTVYEQYTFLQTSDLSFLLRAAHKSKCFENWGAPHASNCPPPQFFSEFFEVFWIFYEFFFEWVQMHPGTETPHSLIVRYFAK